MTFRGSWTLAVLLLPGCSAAPGEPVDGTRERLEDPARVHEVFFPWLGSEDRYGKAHELLTRESKEALPYEAFGLGVTEARNLVPEGYRRLVGGIRQHRFERLDEDRVRVRWCNPDTGWTRDVTLRAERLGKYRLWRIELGRADLESLRPALLRWYDRQKEAANGQRLVYPPGWTYASVGRCDCEP